jgi:hypothetical protein
MLLHEMVITFLTEQVVCECTFQESHYESWVCCKSWAVKRLEQMPKCTWKKLKSMHNFF